jgi:hypothetical protein
LGKKRASKGQEKGKKRARKGQEKGKKTCSDKHPVQKGAEIAESVPFWIREPNERPGFRRGGTGFGGFQ